MTRETAQALRFFAMVKQGLGKGCQLVVNLAKTGKEFATDGNEESCSYHA
jgi:hypothetical protein